MAEKVSRVEVLNEVQKEDSVRDAVDKIGCGRRLCM